MARRLHQRGPVAPEMNITPLIDVVFLLIIFFMIVTKIVSDERTPMIVPQLEDPRTHAPETSRRVIINVARTTPEVNTRRGVMKGPADYAHLAGPGEAEYIRVGGYRTFSLSSDGLDKLTSLLKAEKQASETIKVLVRADAALFYSQVAPVMNAITNARISSVNLVAYEDERPF